MAQYDILQTMIESSDTGKDLRGDLEKRGQEEPAIITCDGYILNGNRRTAALKSIGERYIDCIVLPTDATARDLYELEQELQISKTFKEDYHWINELLNIRTGITDKRYGYSSEDMAKRLRISKADVDSKVQQITLVDNFLIWRNSPKEYDYSKLDDAEQVFSDLEKHLRKTKYETDKAKTIREAVFTLIEERPKTGRLYDHVRYLLKNFDQVYERMLLETQTDRTSQSSDYDAVFDQPATLPASQDMDILDDLVEAESTFSINVFSYSEEIPNRSSALVDLIQNVREEQNERQGAEAVHKAVSTALRNLHGLHIDGSTSMLEHIQNKLTEIITVAEHLRAQADRYVELGDSK